MGKIKVSADALAATGVQLYLGGKRELLQEPQRGDRQ
jgi:hypothetical protein